MDGLLMPKQENGVKEPAVKGGSECIVSQQFTHAQDKALAAHSAVKHELFNELAGIHGCIWSRQLKNVVYMSNNGSWD
eukprot:1144612-Pelagomonas_calceolata.AAC.1